MTDCFAKNDKSSLTVKIQKVPITVRLPAPTHNERRTNVGLGLRAYTCATPPSTNSSIPVIRRIRETHGLGNLIGVPNLQNGTVLEISVFCCSPTSEEDSRYSTQVCRWSLGSSRSRECGVFLNQLSMSARTNAHSSRLLRSGSGGQQALRL